MKIFKILILSIIFYSKYICALEEVCAADGSSGRQKSMEEAQPPLDAEREKAYQKYLRLKETKPNTYVLAKLYCRLNPSSMPECERYFAYTQAREDIFCLLKSLCPSKEDVIEHLRRMSMDLGRADQILRDYKDIISQLYVLDGLSSNELGIMFDNISPPLDKARGDWMPALIGIGRILMDKLREARAHEAAAAGCGA